MRALHALLADDHDRLDVLLAAVIRRDGTVDRDAYTEFRGGLLRHIAIEEKVLFPALRAKGVAGGLIEQLHRDHAALAALLVPPPDEPRIALIRSILTAHNPLEEEADGLYELAERVAGDDLTSILGAVEAIPPVLLAPHADTEVTRMSIERLVREAMSSRKL